METRVIREYKAIKEKVYKDFRATKEYKDNQVELKAYKDSRVIRDFSEDKGQTETKDQMVIKVLSGIKDYKVNKEMKVYKDNKEISDHKDRVETEDFKDSKDFKE